MKKVIGILFPSSKNGGVFQYAQSIGDSLIKYYANDFDYVIFHQSSSSSGERPKFFSNADAVNINYISIDNEDVSLTRKFLHFLNLAVGGNFFIIRNFQEVLKKITPDLLIIPTPFSYDIPYKIPYVVSVPDYMHKYYSFPEYKLKDKLSRDIVYKYYAKNAVLVVADSNQSVDDLYKFSKIKKDKVRVIPYIPPGYVYEYRDMDINTAANLLLDYHLPEKFIFYPAQFWFQKNHNRLIEALHLIKEKHNVRIPLLLVGNAKGDSIYESVYKEVMALIKKLGMAEQVIHLGYVDEKKMVALYKRAVALVAPPFQGPTTLLPLEAMVLGTAVVTTNIFEVPRQVGNAGLFFNPVDIEDMAEKIYKVWIDDNLRKRLVKNGYEQTKNITQENYAKQWKNIIEGAFKILR